MARVPILKRILKTVTATVAVAATVTAAVAVRPSSAADRDLNRLYGKSQLQLGNKKIEAYVADDTSKRANGLMQVTKLKKDTGMIFVFEYEQPLGFWMKDTLIPLSIGYFNNKAELIDILEMKVDPLMTVDHPVYRSSDQAIFALEMESGWYKKNGIKTGAKLKILNAGNSTLLKKHQRTK